MKLQGARKTVGQDVLETKQRKDDRCVGHVQRMEHFRRAKQALHWIPDENRN